MTFSLGIDPESLERSVHQVLLGELKAAAVLLSEGRENAPLAAYGGLLATLSALALPACGISVAAAQDVPVGGQAWAPRARRAARTPVGPGAKGTTSRPPAGLGC